jgi:DNA-binding NtrC family response regulator
MLDVKLDVSRMVESLKQERISVPVVACGIGTDAEAAVRAIRAGAKEYIPLPPDAELIAAVLEAVAQESHALIFGDPAMEQAVRLAERVAPADASVLITGESGTGKEVLARLIHRKSRRAKHAFISVNCAAIPENLLESELFGHEKGAFTGAVARRIGKFEEANGGTLLLDEISEMHPRLQAKLLRAVQEREIDRVGGLQPIRVDIRLIATSNRDLEAEVRAGNFREDLFFRLNVVHLEVPPLRERPKDVALLAEFFAKKYAEVNGVADRPLTPEALQALTRHPWRGNVRELENTMHRAVLLSHGSTIGPESITLSGLKGDETETAAGTIAGKVGLVGRTVADVERDLILETLNHCLGNRTHAANILGISIRTLRNKLQQYRQEGLNVPMPGDGERATA